MAIHKLIVDIKLTKGVAIEKLVCTLFLYKSSFKTSIYHWTIFKKLGLTKNPK